MDLNTWPGREEFLQRMENLYFNKFILSPSFFTYGAARVKKPMGIPGNRPASHVGKENAAIISVPGMGVFRLPGFFLFIF